MPEKNAVRDISPVYILALRLSVAGILAVRVSALTLSPPNLSAVRYPERYHAYTQYVYA